MALNHHLLRATQLSMQQLVLVRHLVAGSLIVHLAGCLVQFCTDHSMCLCHNFHMAVHKLS